MDPEVNNQIDEVVCAIETKVSALLIRYSQLKAENQRLKAEIESLQQQIVHQKNTMPHDSESNIFVNIAKSISESGIKKEELLVSIDRLLKELDEYIVKLND